MSHRNDPPTPGRAGPGNNGHYLAGAKPGRFQKGKSGNPGGHTKATQAMHRLIPTMIAELTHGGADLVYMLLRIAAGAEPGMDDARSRAWAIRELLDRGVGRPQMSLTLKPDTGGDLLQLDDRELSDEELRVLSKLDVVPAKVLQLVPVPAVATEVPPDGDGGSSG